MSTKQIWECFACEGTGRDNCADCGATGRLILYGELTKRGVDLLIELAVKAATSRLLADRDALARELREAREQYWRFRQIAESACDRLKSFCGESSERFYATQGEIFSALHEFSNARVAELQTQPDKGKVAGESPAVCANNDCPST